MAHRDFSPGDAGAALFTVIGLVGLLTLSLPALLLPVGLGLTLRQVRQARRATRELRAASAHRRPAGWVDRLDPPGQPADRREP